MRHLFFVSSVATLTLSACCSTGPESKDEAAPLIYFLEIVTPDVNENCSALEKLHGIRFGEPIAELGNARMAVTPDNGRISIRAPMRADEAPVVRPYLLVDDIEAAVKAAAAAGGQIAMGAEELPGGLGKFAIYLQGGIQYGLWEL
ncbi:MAG: hydroxylase [Planctomycetota bacterium]